MYKCVDDMMKDIANGGDINKVINKYNSINMKYAFIETSYNEEEYNRKRLYSDSFSYDIYINCSANTDFRNNYSIENDDGTKWYHMGYSADYNSDYKDMMYRWKKLVNFAYNYDILIVFLVVVTLLIYMVSMVAVLARSRGKRSVIIRAFDELPFVVRTIFIISLEFLFGCAVYWLIVSANVNIVVLLVLAAMAVVLMLYADSMARQLEKKDKEINLWIENAIKDIKKMPTLIIVLAVLLVITLIELIVMINSNNVSVYVWICFIVHKLFEYAVAVFGVYQIDKLHKGAEKIANGEMTDVIETKELIGDFRKIGEDINKVGEGIAVAVDEKMKSERMKTELITNVSHDIKTPLTSIINYVDLIKKQDIQDDTLNEYVDVLDRQSARLKKLIEDLMEAAKASTGNIKVDKDVFDVKVVLAQALGEFCEKLEKAKLDVIVSGTEGEALAYVDGRHLWRVFDNLINNICKYSMEGTRVYISIENVHNGVRLIFKNTSKEQLNISADELMERFVRGDRSRNTEGSGLGLSIAKSMTELMGGAMDLVIDGDLFKVVLEFYK